MTDEIFFWVALMVWCLLSLQAQCFKPKYWQGVQQQGTAGAAQPQQHLTVVYVGSTRTTRRDPGHRRSRSDYHGSRACIVLKQQLGKNRRSDYDIGAQPRIMLRVGFPQKLPGISFFTVAVTPRRTRFTLSICVGRSSNPAVAQTARD